MRKTTGQHKGKGRGWRKSTGLTLDHGYYRYTAGPHRGKYVHTRIAETLVSETPYSIRLLLPWPYEVHHVDYRKTHNCPSNLILLDIAFHSKMTADGRRHELNGRFEPKRRTVPEWVQDKLPELPDSNQEDECPF